MEKSLLENCDDAEEESAVSELAAVTSCDVGTTPSDVRSNSPNHSSHLKWTRPQSLLLNSFFYGDAEYLAWNIYI